MPVLFGNTYILPAIIVVVLLVLLLLVMALRKRGGGSRAAKATVKTNRRVASPPKPANVQRPPVHEAPGAGVPQTPRAETQPTTAEAAKVVPVRPQTDPLHGMILDIMQGWGDITEDDTKRLSLFRPEKVLAALQSTEVPKELKSNQHARTRLTQLRQYASSRVDQARGQQAATAVVGSPPAIEAESPATQITSSGPLLTDVLPDPPKPAAEPAAIVEGAGEPRPPLVETDYADELSTWSEVETVAESPISPSLPVGVETRLEAPAEVPVEEPLEVAVGTPKWQAEGDTMFLDEPEPDASPSGLRGSVKTADELLALPSAERADMVAFLEPVELSKVFDGTDDPALKKAIIDTLEHVSNPASLEVLRRCLDDPDPQIQLYALEAADRLLGVD